MLNIDINEQVDATYKSLTKDDREDLLKYFIKKEALKKEQEIIKNYKGVRKFNEDLFGVFLKERLINKVLKSSPSEEKELVTV